VSGVHVLRRTVGRYCRQPPLHHLVDQRDQEYEPRSVAVTARIQNGLGTAAEPEDDCALVLAQDAREGADEEERRDGDRHEQERFHIPDHATPPLTSAFAASASVLATRTVSPSTATIRTCVPGSSGAPSATARQISPATSTWPSGARRSRTVASFPTKPSAPVDGGRPSARTPAAITNRKSPAVAATVGPVTHHDARKPIPGASKSMSEPSDTET